MGLHKNKEKKVYTISKKLRIALIVFLLLILALIIRLGFIQFVQGADLKEQMYYQLTKNQIISPKRGTIYDSTGKALATSAQVDTVSISPKYIEVSTNGKTDETKTEELKEKIAKSFSEIFELDYNETLEKLHSNSSYVVIARKVENDKIDKLKKWMNEEEIYTGINIDEDTKRYYPYENLASSLIGFCNIDNVGAEGLESAWNDVLTGTPGKIVVAQDALQGAIPDSNETYIPAQNGSDITLTIDANIQSIVEKYLKQACIENKCSRGGNAIMMNPQTGDILAMATYPDYNLNEPLAMPSNIEKKDWDKMNSEEKTNTIYSLYRNRAVTDSYEPGSVFKIITASIALEENIEESDVANEFNCISYQVVSGVKMYCSQHTVHGKQSLRQALSNSCNSAFIQLGQKIGANTCYRYYKAFGFFDKTGIATAGELKNSIFWDLKDVGKVELATMSYGQRFKITPLQMITAVSAIANDGILMQPRIIKEIKNTDTGAVTTVDPVQVRQVVSKETADTMLDMLESVVATGGGTKAQVKGYSIAGKTGTSEPDPYKDEGYTASFLAIAPTENPEVVLLVTFYDPNGPKGIYGSSVAAPVASQILKEVLPYLQVPSDSAENTDSNKTTNLPNVVNKTVAEAKKILEKAGFTCSTSAESTEIVTEQYPLKGTALMKNAIVKLYTNSEDTRISKQVPNLIGKNLSQVKDALRERNLNLNVTGTGTVVSQDPIADTSVEEGTVVKVTLSK